MLSRLARVAINITQVFFAGSRLDFTGHGDNPLDLVGLKLTDKNARFGVFNTSVELP